MWPQQSFQRVAVAWPFVLMMDCHASPHPRQLRIGGKARDPHLPAGMLSGMKCCSLATNQTINLTGAQQIPLWRGKKKKIPLKDA